MPKPTITQNTLPPDDLATSRELEADPTRLIPEGDRSEPLPLADDANLRLDDIRDPDHVTETFDGGNRDHPTHDMDADDPLPEDIEADIGGEEGGRAEMTAERIEGGIIGSPRRLPADDI